MTIHQISVFLENRGRPAGRDYKGAGRQRHRHAGHFPLRKPADYGVLRLIVDQPQKTTATLLEHGFVLSMTPVTVVAVPDQPGGLAPVLQLVAEGSIDIEYMYSLFTHKEGRAYMVFRVSDDEKFTALLQEHGIAAVSSEELGIES